MQIALDIFNCTNCGELLRTQQIHRGTDCRCPCCGQVQVIPGKRMSLLGKVANALFYVGDTQGMPQSRCPYCHSMTPTLANVCHQCCHTLPPLV